MKRALLALVLLSSILGAQDPAPVDEVVRLNDEAVDLSAKGENEKAAKLLRKAIDLRKIASEPVDPMLETNLVRVLIGCAADLADRKEWGDAEARLLEARRIDGKDSRIYAWEGVIAYRRGLFNSAMDRLEEALRHDAKLALGHEYQGMIHYKRENLELALRSFRLAIEIEPDRKKRLEPFMTKLERELAREGSMRFLRSTHFVCKFGAEQERRVAEEVLGFLEDAYTKVGGAIREYPEERLTVVLYADRDFHSATGAQGWAAGIFDGKIRVPIRNFRGVRRQIRATLFHEYTHFVVSKIAREAPAWLNEGLAQVMEERTARDVLGIIRPLIAKDALPKVRELVASFSSETDALKVRVFYAQSLSFVDWLRERNGVARLGDLLRRLGVEKDIDAACKKVYGETLDELDAAWRRSF